MTFKYKAFEEASKKSDKQLSTLRKVLLEKQPKFNGASSEIKEIMVRCYTPEVFVLQSKICDLIAEYTDMTPIPVDHTNLSLEDFDVGDAMPISIDKHLAHGFNIPYIRISRVFDIEGNLRERMIRIPQGSQFKNICIIDTDICSGDTMRMACRMFETTKFRVPLQVGPNQDLIDVEDLIFDDSLLFNGGTVSYLANAEFFSKRTSLPKELYDPIYKMIVETDARSNFI
jgi:hypothetical protein